MWTTKRNETRAARETLPLRHFEGDRLNRGERRVARISTPCVGTTFYFFLKKKSFFVFGLCVRSGSGSGSGTSEFRPRRKNALCLPPLQCISKCVLFVSLSRFCDTCLGLGVFF